MTTPNSKTIKLINKPDEVAAKLEERIVLGREIEETIIPKVNGPMYGNQDDLLYSLTSPHKKWQAYNIKLLTTTFSTDEVASNYVASMDPIVIQLDGVQSKIKKLLQDVRYEVCFLETLVETLELYEIQDSNSRNHSTVGAEKNADMTKIFVVHGHDNELKQEVARFIEKIGFTPVILHEQSSSSETIIEKIERYSNVGFGVVLYTPCDIGAKFSESPDFNRRARQNVVFEHGFLIGKLGRKNVCALVKGEVEKPNDISGVVYVSIIDDGWKLQLAKELIACGYDIDMNRL